ncbi:hypothetical protein [Myceligenerans cantabricum]
MRSLARHGSIGSVARNEHHSETVVRRHLKDLSRACAVEVVDTSDGVARVTSAGMLLLDRFAPIHDDQEFVQDRLQRLLTLRESDLIFEEVMARTVRSRHHGPFHAARPVPDSTVRS